jgi:hypothetical protein
MRVGNHQKDLLKKIRNIRFDAPKRPLPNGENRRSLAPSYLELFEEHSRLFYFEMDINTLFARMLENISIVAYKNLFVTLI